MATGSGNDDGARAKCPRRGRNVWRVVAASVVGTSLEWYDFFLYGTAAALVFSKPVLPPVRPPRRDAAAFATYAVGFVARPLGGVIFGHFGDRIGRKQVLVATLLIMGVATFAHRPAAHLRHDRRRGPDPAGVAAVRAGPRARRRVGRAPC